MPRSGPLDADPAPAVGGSPRAARPAPGGPGAEQDPDREDSVDLLVLVARLQERLAASELREAELREAELRARADRLEAALTRPGARGWCGCWRRSGAGTRARRRRATVITIAGRRLSYRIRLIGL